MLIPPMAFIPAAERYGLMPQLDRWVIRNAFAQHKRCHGSGNYASTCAINLSATSISDDNFYEFVAEQLDLQELPPQEICFEITETSAIANLTQAVSLIEKMKALGCRIALDDFGSGMSSFAYLKHLPVDYLKIDGEFVKDLISDSVDQAMVEAINAISHTMRIETIAEFVENEAILEKLRIIGVDYGQGYGIEKPRLMP
jgi:EAL domain-containing protein (putative c-di-GMP-specific phosphodiesterase class I)